MLLYLNGDILRNWVLAPLTFQPCNYTYCAFYCRPLEPLPEVVNDESVKRIDRIALGVVESLITK